MNPLALARLYFDLSNRSDLAGIRKFMTDGTTFSAEGRGIFLGVDSIMDMQAAFHGQFEALHWDVSDVEEVKPGIVRFEFVFSARAKSGEEVRRSGIEHVVVHDGKLRHIEVRDR